MTDMLQRIRLNCTHCEDTGCMEWQGWFWEKPLLRVKGKQVPVRRLVLQELGKWVRGRVASNSCRNPRCVAEEHALAMTRKQLQRRTASTTNYSKSTAHRAAIAKAKRASGVLTEEAVREMRQGGMLIREAAEKFGCSEQAAWKAMTHQTWKDYSSPFSGLGARA